MNLGGKNRNEKLTKNNRKKNTMTINVKTESDAMIAIHNEEIKRMDKLDKGQLGSIYFEFAADLVRKIDKQNREYSKQDRKQIRKLNRTQLV